MGHKGTVYKAYVHWDRKVSNSMQINQSISCLIIPSHRAMVSFSVISTVNRLPVRQAHETFLVANVSGLDLGLNPYSVEWVPRPVSPVESGRA